MIKSPFIRLFLILALIFSFFLIKPAPSSAAEKLGIVFADAGEGEEYGVRWRIGYFDHLFPFWPAGFFAGRAEWEGETCYTHVHFANESEAIICGVSEGTLIDIFCDAHPEYEGYDNETGDPIVHGIFRHSWMTFPPVNGDDTFRENCFDDGGTATSDPAVLYTMLGSETVNPYGADELDNLGPHVDDPYGPGIGIADFIETTGFNSMLTHYYTFNALNYKNPYEGQVKEWYYGDNGTANIKDVLEAAILADPGIDNSTQLVYRRTSEAFARNVDEYGNPKYYPESCETAFNELIDDEEVDRIIVFALSSGYVNLINYGPCWRDKNGDGISVIPGVTYKECIENVNDGYGPTTEALRDQLIEDKPWDKYVTIMREASHLIEGRVPLSFTRDYGTSGNYDLAVLKMLEYTVANYGIPDNGSSLKVLLTTHGYAGGHLDGAECDVSFRTAEETTNRIIHTITSTFSWSGKFEIKHAGVEFAQPDVAGGNMDPPSEEKPFGDEIGAGELVDMAIKGKYINELGQVVDNGIIDNATNEIFDYIILIPNTFDAESSDTLGHFRGYTLGNQESGTVEGSIETWVRQGIDQNGLEYGDPDAIGTPYYPFHDENNFTVRVMDATGWCSTSEDEIEVCKGVKDNETNPTVVILSGTILSYPDNETDAREYLTDAAVEVIIEAIKDPEIGGYEDCDIQCYADFDNSGKVDLGDLNILKQEFFNEPCILTPPVCTIEIHEYCCCRADIDGSGKVDLTELNIMKDTFFDEGCPPRTPPCTFP